jgi:hypothetical protein
MSLPRLTFLCHPSWPTCICQIPNFLPRLRQIPCNHHFLGGIIQTRDVMSWWGPRPFQLNSCKNFKNQVWKLVSKRRVESVKEVCHWSYCHGTSSEWRVIEIARRNTDIARKVDSRRVLNCQSFCYGFLPFCILFWDHISSFNETCRFFVLLLCWNQEMLLSKGILIKYFWSNSNMQN